MARRGGSNTIVVGVKVRLILVQVSLKKTRRHYHIGLASLRTPAIEESQKGLGFDTLN